MSSRGIFLLVLSLISGVHCGSGEETGGQPGVLCGNGVVEPPELCDGASCPSACDDDDDCTTDTLTGDAASCSAVCVHEPIEACAPATCGDRVVDEGEVCDDGPANGSAWSAAEHCNASCSGSAPHCGDGAIDTTHESCGERGLAPCAAGEACIACACAPCMPSSDPTLAARLVLGDIVDLAPAPQRLYAVDGHGLQILDLADPANPTLLGMVAFPAAQAVAVAGTHAYVVDTDVGLAIVDAADATNATSVGSYFIADTNDVAVAGSHAYVASSTFDVVDVSDPTNPTPVASLDLFVTAVAIDGSYAYLATYDTLRVVDISDPTSPTVVGMNVVGGGFADALAVGSGVAYVALDDEIRVHDVSDPTDPTPVGIYDAPNFVSSLAATGSFVYAAYGGFPHGVAVVNATNPAAPALAGTITAWQPGAVATGGGLTYVAGSLSGYPDLYVLDVYDTPVPGTGTYLGSYDAPEDARSITLEGGYAYLADDRKLQVFDVSDPETPLRRKSQMVAGYARGVRFAAGHVYYVSDSTGTCMFDAYLRIFDAVDPANPLLVGSLNFPQSCAHDVAVAAGHAYVGLADLGVVSVADPTMPVLAATYDMQQVAETTIVGSLAYVAQSQGVSILDITAPATPTLVGSVDLPNGATGVTVAGDRAYVAGAGAGLFVLDVSSPASPLVLGSLATPGGALKVALANEAAIVAAGASVEIVDVSDPGTPTLVGSYATSDTAWDVAYADGHAYVAAGTDGALVLRVCE
jgi:hypothetical protein